jgi:hypothetical protein
LIAGLAASADGYQRTAIFACFVTRGFGQPVETSDGM